MRRGGEGQEGVWGDLGGRGLTGEGSAPKMSFRDLINVGNVCQRTRRAVYRVQGLVCRV
jgi:hypothetical protein